MGTVPKEETLSLLGNKSPTKLFADSARKDICFGSVKNSKQ
jgi:hypothetical protein